VAKLSVWLPPFSPDYSGAASSFFDLNAVTVMHDASGCTGNYTGYDEPRWYGSSSPIYCSGLREIDVIMGDDEKLIRKVLKAGQDLRPDLFALIGSPVPMVTGCDLRGVARELEARSGVISIGLDTTGTAYYDHGLHLAGSELLRRFGEEGPARPGTVNILGANPMDFGVSGNLADLRRLLSENGIEILACLTMNYDLDSLRNAPKAQMNLAVSRAGFRLAEYMRLGYGQPFLAGLPIGVDGAAAYITALRNVMKTGDSRVIKGEPASGSGQGILIIGEQIQSNCVRRALNFEYGMDDVTVGALYGLERELALEHDVDLPDERAIRAEINMGRYGLVIADPFLHPLLTDRKKRFFLHAQYAVSSKLGAAYCVDFIGDGFNRWFDSRIRGEDAAPEFLEKNISLVHER
jgi:hypothetical protein